MRIPETEYLKTTNFLRKSVQRCTLCYNQKYSIDIAWAHDEKRWLGYFNSHRTWRMQKRIEKSDEYYM